VSHPEPTSPIDADSVGATAQILLTVRPTRLASVNARVDEALAENRRVGWLIISMALALFAVGLLIVAVAYWLKNPYVASAAVLAQTFLIFPMNEIRKLRRDNLILQTFPVLIDGLPKDEAAGEIRKLLAYLRGGK
jgi:Flp pilus assembly protein TadB